MYIQHVYDPDTIRQLNINATTIIIIVHIANSIMPEMDVSKDLVIVSYN